jgi:integrase
MATPKRAARGSVVDLWHRSARDGELVFYPADQADGPVWCMDRTHFKRTGTMVCTTRHSQGKRWRAAWVDHDCQQRAKAFDGKIAAQQHIDAITTQLGTGTYADPQRSAVTFGTIAETWIKGKAGKAPKTVAGYRGLLDVVILPKWKNEPLRDISHERLQAWIGWLSTDPSARMHAKRDGDGEIVKTGLSPARVIQIHQVVHQVFDYAIRAKYLAVNPADHIELPSKPQSKDLALSHEQVRQLAEEMAGAEASIRHRRDTVPSLLTPPELGTMVRFLAYSGLRFGECIALRVSSVDIENRRVMVGRSITQVRGQGRLEGDTKTHQRRSAPILTTALAEELTALVRGRDPTEFLFPGPDGEAMTIGWFNARFGKAVAKLGIEGVTPHTLRHSAGSLALQLGASVPTVQKLLGHRNATTTMNVYSHMMPDDFDNLAAAMDKATT